MEKSFRVTRQHRVMKAPRALTSFKNNCSSSVHTCLRHVLFKQHWTTSAWSCNFYFWHSPYIYEYFKTLYEHLHRVWYDKLFVVEFIHSIVRISTHSGDKKTLFTVYYKVVKMILSRPSLIIKLWIVAYILLTMYSQQVLCNNCTWLLLVILPIWEVDAVCRLVTVQKHTQPLQAKFLILHWFWCIILHYNCLLSPWHGFYDSIA